MFIDIVNSFWKMLSLSGPYIFMGLVVSAFLHRYLPAPKVVQGIGKENIWSVLKATLWGMPLPLCSCGVLPAAKMLQQNGASRGATSAFLITTPESGVDSIMMTFGLMGPKMAALRVMATFISGMFAGVMQILLNPRKMSHNRNGVEGAADKSLKQSFQYAFGKLFHDIAKWLMVGLFLAGLIDALMPPDFFENLNPHGVRFTLLLVGIPLYICASASTPLALSLILKGVAPGSVLVLLMVGPATNLANMLVTAEILGKKGAVIHIVSIVIITLLVSYGVDLIYPAFNQEIKRVAVHSHGEEVSVWGGVVLVVLYLKYIKEKWL